MKQEATNYPEIETHYVFIISDSAILQENDLIC